MANGKKIIKGLGLLSVLMVSLSGFLYESCKEVHTVGNTIFAMVCLSVFGWTFGCILDNLINGKKDNNGQF